MGIYETLKSAWKSVKNWFTNDEEETPIQETTTTNTTTTPTTTPTTNKLNWATLNEVANSLNSSWVQQQQQLQLNANPLGQFKANQEAQAEANKIMNEEMPDPTEGTTTWFIGNTKDIIKGNVQDVINEENQNKKKWFWESLKDISNWSWLDDTISSAVDYWVELINWLNASSDYDAKKKQMAMYYDKDNWNVYYLDINTSKGLADWDSWAYDWAQILFDKEMAKFNQAYSQADAAWDEQGKAQALNNFYNSTKKLFRLKSDDYYSDGWIFNWEDWARVWRRKDLYSDETLEKLSANNIDTSKKYEPTLDEFVQYLWILQDNEQLQSNIYKSYWLDTPKWNTIDLSESATQKWKSWFYDKAMTWVMDYAKTYLSSDAQTNTILAAADIVTDQQNRIYNIVAEVYKKEQVALAKPDQERNEWDKALIEGAEKLRKMEVLYAWNISNVINQNIKYGRDWSWDLTFNIDYFDWGKTLNQALTENIKEVAWWDWWSTESAIDVFHEVANKALYEYEYANDGWLSQRWDWMQRAWEKVVWEPLSELWQQLVYAWMWVRNIVWDLAFDRNALEEFLKWERALSTTANYADNDFTIWRLLQTDMWNNTRTIYKYWLQGMEYAPETVGNLAPDVAAAVLTWWGSVWVSAVRWWARTNDAIKAAKATWLIWRLAKAVQEWSTLAKVPLKGIEWLSYMLKGIQNAWNKVPELRVIAQMADRALTQWLIDQAIDAQWSQFDTEPYSNTSMILSLTGTWLGELLPIAWKGWRVLANRLSDTSDILWYIKNNPEGIQNIAKSMNIPLSDLSYDDLYRFLDNFSTLWDAAKKVYNTLSKEWKVAANQWTKKVMYNYLNQFYDLNNQSMVAKSIRRIVNDWATNPADLFKYVGKIAWTVELGPYVSTIQLKNGTQAAAVLKNWEYDAALDQINGWFASKISNWFTQWDLEDISKIRNYSDILENKDKLFRKVDNKYYLSQEWLDHFWLKAENQWLESLWIALEEAENVRELFREKMKAIRETDKAIKPNTIDAIADSWAYTDVVEKIQEIVC